MKTAPWWFPLLIFFVISSATVGWVAVGEDSFTGPPGAMGDDVYFENIAFHIAKGEGIKFDFTDAQWQRPYRDANLDQQNDWVLFLEARGQTTSRSPGFPAVVAGVYRVFGRRFWVVRVLNLLLLSIAVTLLLSKVSQVFGAPVGLLALLTLSLDCFVLRTTAQFMTEALGTAVICLLFTGCVVLTSWRQPGPLHRPGSPQVGLAARLALGWLLMGLLFGFGALVRANLNAWFPLIVGTLGAMVLWRWWFGQLWRPLLLYGGLFSVGVLAVAGPYWVRNCRVTGDFAPFGTSGSFGLVGGYCDWAYENFGNWSIEAAVDSQKKAMRQPGFFELSLAEQEWRMGKESTRSALGWAKENVVKLPTLAGMKMISHLGFYRQPLFLQCLNGAMMLLALFGCFVRRQTAGYWVLAFFFLSLVTTMLAWPHYGRYSIPLRPLIHVASAIGGVALWNVMRETLQKNLRKKCSNP